MNELLELEKENIQSQKELEDAVEIGKLHRKNLEQKLQKTINNYENLLID
jgi:hypothetical protein